MSPPQTKPVIDLLGGPGSGKSAVAADFAGLGCGVIDADRLAREALDEPEVKDQLRAWWGAEVIQSDGGVNRKAVAAKVFADDAELARLEALIHPRVHARRRELREKMLADPALVAVVEDCPLLLEKNLQQPGDVLVFVDAPRSVRLARLAERRGWDRAELDRREKHQWPLDMKRQRADYVINNGGDEASRLDQTRRVLSKITT